MQATHAFCVDSKYLLPEECHQRSPQRWSFLYASCTETVIRVKCPICSSRMTIISSEGDLPLRCHHLLCESLCMYLTPNCIWKPDYSKTNVTGTTSNIPTCLLDSNWSLCGTLMVTYIVPWSLWFLFTNVTQYQYHRYYMTCSRTSPPNLMSTWLL